MEKVKRRVIINESHPFYYISLSASKEVIELEDELDILMKETENREMTEKESNLSFELQHKLEMKEIIAPIFAVTAAESFIHTYSTMKENENIVYSIEHLDKLDTYSKWIIIPAILCGKEIEKSSTAMNEFKRLIKIRNTIVHPKPMIINNPTEQQFLNAGNKTENNSIARREIAKKSPTIFLNLVKELQKIDNSKELKEIIKNYALPI